MVVASTFASLGALVPEAGAAPDSWADVDDHGLIARTRRDGDHAAFAELIRRHQGKVRGLLRRLCQDPCLADDLAQEVFLRAYRGLVGFEGRARFSTWIYRIAYNVFLNHRSRVRPHRPLPDGFASVGDERESVAVARIPDLRRDLRGAIDKLPPQYRMVVILYYLQDVTYPEIAMMLDLPLGTVKTHLHRARLRLREELQGWGDT